MTSLSNYLYHERMAREWVLNDASDIDFQTPGVVEKMVDERNKYSPKNISKSPNYKVKKESSDKNSVR